MPKRKGAGKYTEYLDFHKMPNPSAQDTIGAPIGVPVHHFYSYGAFYPKGSDEFNATNKRWSETTAVFAIPYQDISINAGTHQIVMNFDPTTSPPTTSTWNVLGSYGDRFETIVEANETK